MVRLSKGAGFSDAYALLSRPFLAWVLPRVNGFMAAGGFGGALSPAACWKRTTGACALCWSYSNKDQRKETFPLP